MRLFRRLTTSAVAKRSLLLSLVVLTALNFAFCRDVKRDPARPKTDVVFYFFHSSDCPHCVKAAPFFDALTLKYPQIVFKKLEVGFDLENRAFYKQKIGELNLSSSGVPLFVFGKSFVVGYSRFKEHEIEAMIKKELSERD